MTAPWRDLRTGRIDLPALLSTGPGRLLRFGAVGGVTGVVQLVMLETWKALGVAAVPAYALGLAIALQVNFTLNVFLVWADRPVGNDKLRALILRWFTYHACVALAVGINFGIFVIARGSIPDLAAAVVAILGSTLVKFVSLDRLAFRVSD